MKSMAYRAGLAAPGALIIFIIDAAIGRVLFPGVSIISVHLITLVVAAALTFLVLLYAAPQRHALHQTRRQPDLSEDANRLLVPLLANLREGILVVTRGSKLF